MKNKLHVICQLLLLNTLFSLASFAELMSDENSSQYEQLLEETRRSLHLSLCVVVFEEEYQDFERAALYLGGLGHVQEQMQQNGWTDDEQVMAFESVLDEDFSFELTQDESWSQYRRQLFTTTYCDELFHQKKSKFR